LVRPCITVTGWPLSKRSTASFCKAFEGSNSTIMSNPENDDERLAREWLVALSGDPESVCRPRCDPPDFVFNGSIAVEVTRLSEGDETSLHSLGPVVEDVLSDLGPPGNGLSLCVFWVYEPSRSFPEAKRTKEQVRDALMPYTKAYTMPAGIEDLRLLCGLSLRLVHIQPTEGPARFVFGGFSGMTGGHVRDKLLNDLTRAVRKKSIDISNRRNHFDTWWLALVDRVFSSENFTFDGTNEGKRLLIAMKSIVDELSGAEGHSWPWSRIIVLEPSVPCRGYFLVDKDGLGGSNN